MHSHRQKLQHSSGYHPTVISVEMKKLTDCPRLEVKKTQFWHPISYPEVKTLIQHKLWPEWCHQHNITGEDTSLMELERWQQTIIFRLRTGHCRLLSHMHRLKISPSMECPYGTGTQDPEHILQECPTYTIERTRSWPIPMNFWDKLWGTKCELINTTQFIRNVQILI